MQRWGSAGGSVKISERSPTLPQGVRGASIARRSRTPVWREVVYVALILTLAVAIRLALAARGWPAVDSDEATMGLMADDILRHGAHPLFFYGQNYLGPFQAYLAAPIFALLGPTNFALYVTTTLETVIFLLILYPLTRMVFSPTVAIWTLLLLAVGPYEALYFDLRAGAGLQETLLLGTLLLLLTYLRLRTLFQHGNAPSLRGRLYAVALDVALGAVAGLALWAHLLTVPFILTSMLALVALRGYQLIRIWRRGSARASANQRNQTANSGARRDAGRPQAIPIEQLQTQPVAAIPFDQLLTQPIATVRQADPQNGWRILGGLLGQTLLFVVGFVALAFPFIAANIASHGATFTQTFGIAGSGGSPHPGLVGHIISLIQQIAATLLIGLPRLLNETLLCPTCVQWPRPHTIVSHSQMLHEAIISLPLSLLVIALWAVNVVGILPLSWRRRLRLGAIRAFPENPRNEWSKHPVEPTMDDAVWWGRLMFVVGAALVLLEYVASRASYAFPDTSARYLIGVYTFTPLVVAPLVQWSWPFWSQRLRASGLHKPGVTQSTRRRLVAFGASALLAASVLVSVLGVAKTMSITQDRSLYGVPAGARDAQVIQFLLNHQATRFYTTYWVCNRLMFEAAERITCSVMSDTSAFSPGVNRIGANKLLLGATPHPAYVLDSQDSHMARGMAAQVSAAIAAGDPRLRGYVSAVVADFHIFYYPAQT